MHFLDKFRADHLGDGATTRTCDEDACISRGHSRVLFHAAQELEDLLRLARLMTLVVLPDRLVGRCINHNRLDSCGTYVEANQKLLHRPSP